MASYAAFGLLLICLAGVATGSPAGKSPEDVCQTVRAEQAVIHVIQEKCEETNEMLLNAGGMPITEDNKQYVCNQFFRMLKCGARHIKTCFMNIMKMLAQYQHSPWYCLLDADKLKQIQSLRNAIESDNGEDPLTPPSEATTQDSGPNPFTHGQEKGQGTESIENKGNVDEKGYQTKKDTNQGTAKEGNKEGHTGTDKNGARHLMSCGLWTVLLVTMVSRSLLWSLVS